MGLGLKLCHRFQLYNLCHKFSAYIALYTTWSSVLKYLFPLRQITLFVLDDSISNYWFLNFLKDVTNLFRLEQKDNMTDPLKKIELFKAIASPAYIVASLEYFNEVSADFFCPVKKLFEFACEANFRKATIPEYKREYEEIENRLVYFFSYCCFMIL